MTPRTYTYTWTQTRLETIQDQFRYLMTYAGFKGNNIDRLVDGVGERAVAQSVSMDAIAPVSE